MRSPMACAFFTAMLFAGCAPSVETLQERAVAAVDECRREKAQLEGLNATLASVETAINESSNPDAALIKSRNETRRAIEKQFQKVDNAQTELLKSLVRLSRAEGNH